MTYSAKYPTAVHSFILSLMLVQGIYQFLHGNYGRGFVQITIGLLIVFSYFIRYQVTLKKTAILYNILFLRSVIFSREIITSDIRKIVFKRSGRSSRCAYIYTNKLLPIRLVNFRPEEMYEKLLLFGKRNLITIIMSDDSIPKHQDVTEEG
ncbi:hypothetical protein AB685_01365 [Bacillus sp. LL01]|uniref:hypothetical protein n=1 Tax=Bacillus sp. LL01 TaxID=1665556 RepID=UPI00064CEF22|nr:hypothetical protein [Bacillus sp. LL01]KMJ59556.1 hypothetical protein AB685_01365 [Bacillus sp. LL01]